METLAYALLFGLIAREAFGVPLLPSDPKPFIYGGEDAPEGYAPYMVALVIGDRVRSHWCGGSIISRSLVLTSAHCVEPLIMDDGTLFETFHTRVGSNQWNSGGTIVNIKDFHIHPKFDSKNHKHDVAVLPTAENIQLSEKVAVIGMAFDYVGENEGCLITGWGRTGPRMEGDVLHMQPTPDDLQALHTTTMSYKRCQKQMTEVTGGHAPSIEDPIEMCTFHSVGHGMCLGDAGNPVVRLSPRPDQIAIVSWGSGCAEGGPDVSVRMSGYSIRNFLEQILNLYQD